MFKINKKNIAAVIVALVTSLAFLLAVLSPPSVFNLLPAELHESMESPVVSENSFVRIFDVCSSVVLMIIAYIAARNCFTAFGLFNEK